MDLREQLWGDAMALLEAGGAEDCVSPDEEMMSWFTTNLDAGLEAKRQEWYARIPPIASTLTENGPETLRETIDSVIAQERERVLERVKLLCMDDQDVLSERMLEEADNALREIDDRLSKVFSYEGLVDLGVIAFLASAFAARVAYLMVQAAQAFLPQLAATAMERLKQLLSAHQEAANQAVQGARTVAERLTVGLQQLQETFAEAEKAIPGLRDSRWQEYLNWRGLLKDSLSVLQMTKPTEVKSVLQEIAGTMYHLRRAADQVAFRLLEAGQNPRLNRIATRAYQALYNDLNNCVAAYEQAVGLVASRSSGAVVLHAELWERGLRNMLNTLIPMSMPMINKLAEQLAGQAGPDDSPEQVADRGVEEVRRWMSSAVEDYLQSAELALSRLSVSEPPTGLPMTLPTIGEVSDNG